MKYFLFVFTLLTQAICFCQNETPVEITPSVQKRIMQEIEKKVLELKQHLEQEREDSVYIEFAVDTFRVEQFMAKCVNLDYSDFGIRNAIYSTAKRYDSLLNKYFSKLMHVLKGDDKNVLVHAQKAWLLFRDNEMHLVETLSKNDYSGGGTVEQLTEASMYLNLIKSRTIAVFDLYQKVIQNF